jgi:hypothetical protein
MRGGVGDQRPLCNGVAVLGRRTILTPSRPPGAIGGNGMPIRGAKGDIEAELSQSFGDAVYHIVALIVFGGSRARGRIVDRDFDSLAEFQRAGRAECDFHPQDAHVYRLGGDGQGARRAITLRQGALLTNGCFGDTASDRNPPLLPPEWAKMTRLNPPPFPKPQLAESVHTTCIARTLHPARRSVGHARSS